MIRPVHDYCRSQIRPRLSRIVVQPQVLVAAAIWAVVVVYGSCLPVAAVKPGDIVTAILTYAAISFGFCIAGLAMVLTFPNDRFLMVVCRNSISGSGTTSYSDLLFIFSWTAVCHWVLVLLGLYAFAVRGAREVLLNQFDGLGWKVLVASLMALVWYCLIQFLITVITMSQLGEVYQEHLLADPSEVKCNCNPAPAGPDDRPTKSAAPQV